MYKLLFILLTSSIYSLTSYCQEDLRDYLVGEYEYTSIETYSNEDGEFNEEGILKVINHKNDSTVLVQVISGERVINEYLLKLLIKKDTAIVLEIPKHESPKSKYFIQSGRKIVNLKNDKVEGVYLTNSNRLIFFIYTDMIYVKEHGTKLFNCKKIK